MKRNHSRPPRPLAKPDAGKGGKEPHWKRTPVHGTRIVAACFLVCSLAMTGYLWWGLQLYGFPDGHLTEFDRARVPWDQGYLVLNLVWGLFFGWVVRAGRDGTAVNVRFPVCLYLVSFGLYLAVVYSLGLTCEHGQGG